ncbi:MAG: tyrosine-type recombinase/integrase, partial [Candidatus Dormibacteria bacterium]
RGGRGEGTPRTRVRCACGGVCTPTPEVRACPSGGAAAAGRPVTWEARFVVGEGPGQVRRSIYAPTRQEVVVLLDEERRRITRGEAPTDRRQTVGSYLAGWLAGKERALRPSTWLTYQGYIERSITPDLGRLRLTELGPRHVDAWIDAKLEAGLSPRTVSHLRAILRAALNDARRRGLVDRNAAALAGPPRVEKLAQAPMTSEEADRILRAVAGTEIETPVAVALQAGLRLGEVLGLAWHDVDLEARTLRVRQALSRLRGVTTLGPPKSVDSRRVVPMTRPLTALLASHREQEAVKRARLCLPEVAGEALVFTNRASDPLDPSWVSHAFHDRLAEAGLPPRRFHDLRHGCAALLLASGADLKVVSSILGHSSIRLTADTYAGVVDRLRGDAAEGLERLLRLVAAPTQ